MREGHETVGSMLDRRWGTMVMLAQNMNSATKSRSLTASIEFGVTPLMPRSCKRVGKRASQVTRQGN